MHVLYPCLCELQLSNHFEIKSLLSRFFQSMKIQTVVASLPENEEEIVGSTYVDFAHV
jgi:hypothetical protein